ncbi:hypothetical protein BF95_11790 [Sphingobium sp. Ant17]|nr:hypothetical protein BF95_11790 [Sphingobium sp. Ant17]
MPSGIEIYDESGNLTVDRFTSLGRILGSVNTNGSSGFINHEGFATGQPLYFVYAQVSNNQWAYEWPDISFSGQTMSWSYQSNITVNNTIVYGVY